MSHMKHRQPKRTVLYIGRGVKAAVMSGDFQTCVVIGYSKANDDCNHLFIILQINAFPLCPCRL